jgi:hypothetical protein
MESIMSSNIIKINFDKFRTLYYYANTLKEMSNIPFDIENDIMLYDESSDKMLIYNVKNNKYYIITESYNIILYSECDNVYSFFKIKKIDTIDNISKFDILKYVEIDGCVQLYYDIDDGFIFDNIKTIHLYRNR